MLFVFFLYTHENIFETIIKVVKLHLYHLMFFFLSVLNIDCIYGQLQPHNINHNTQLARNQSSCVLFDKCSSKFYLFKFYVSNFVFPLY